VNTNRLYPGSNDFRYYVDLNRNGRFDTNGWLPELDDFLRPMTVLSNGVQVIPLKFFVGDPEWVGVLEKPEYHHSPTNLFIGRYAYVVIPASKTLDVNYVHNYAKGVYSGFSQTMPINAGDGFMRNQGAGTYEMNLAAFLTDLNTNYWPYPARSSAASSYWWPVASPPFFQPYAYNPVFNTGNVVANNGAAFYDAMALVRYRYFGNTANVQPFGGLFGAAGVNSFVSSGIDGYGAGPVMTTAWWVTPNQERARAANSAWPGSYNPYHFYSHQDFFDTTKTTTGTTPYNLTTRLLSAGAGSNSYNRYTYYRMLSQLGTDTGPESPKINLNYVNIDTNNGNIVPAMVTNFQAWDATLFFTNAANRLLKQAGFTFDTTGIQIYPTNFYTASVHRLLQLTANIYDATTNRTYGVANATNGFPTVFRPHFLRTTTNGTMVFIVGYTELAPADHVRFAGISGAPPAMRDLSLGQFPLSNDDMVKGFPLVIGARKGLPNFNEMELRTKIQATRKLEFIKHNARDISPYRTNQMYLLSITNEFGLEAWNSFTNAYPRDLRMTVVAEMVATMTNELSLPINSNNLPYSNYVFFATPSPSPIIPANTWFGFTPLRPAASFFTPFSPATNHFMFLSKATYSTRNRQFVVPYQSSFELNQDFPVPHWWLNLRSSLRFILFDAQANRIVDYVNLAYNNDPFDITTALFNGGKTNGVMDAFYGSMWVTNRPGGSNAPISVPTYGIMNQIGASLGVNTNQLDWKTALAALPPGWDRQGAINFFRHNLANLPPIGTLTTPLSLTNRFYAPIEPTRDIYLYNSWQANDPLVHYTVGDLTPMPNTNACDWDTSARLNSTVGNIGFVNSRYEPWPGNSLAGGSGSPTLTDIRVKDPLVTQPSDWEFPTNKFPNVGWLGRVHRGTPWQTVYLKAAPAIPLIWQNWSGNGRLLYNIGQVNTNLVPLKMFYADSLISSPTNDWRLLDLFTAALSDTATHGQLSVNQTNLAAWSAVLSGVIVNSDLTNYSVIQPAGTYSPLSPPPLVTLYNAINDVRRTNYAGAFQRLGDLLSVPELTVRSPFLSAVQGAQSDAVMERIPQQILGLLKGGEQPRFVIYTYGQALKPADRSRVTTGPYLSLCTNYQITAEVTTRSVVRIDGAPANPRATVESFDVLPPD